MTTNKIAHESEDWSSMLPGKANGTLCTPAASPLVRHSIHPGTKGSATVITASVLFSVKKPAHSTWCESELTESRICFWLNIKRASLVAQLVKNPPAMQETPVWFLGLEDLLEKGQATYSSILAFKTNQEAILLCLPQKWSTSAIRGHEKGPWNIFPRGPSLSYKSFQVYIRGCRVRRQSSGTKLWHLWPRTDRKLCQGSQET